MTYAARLFTAAEAGAVSGLDLKAVHNAIDKRIVDPVSSAMPSGPGPGQSHGPPRLLTAEDLVRLRLWRGVGATLTAERRQRLFRALKPDLLAPTETIASAVGG